MLWAFDGLGVDAFKKKLSCVISRKAASCIAFITYYIF